MTDEELVEIVDNIGFEQIMVDAGMDVRRIAMILHESGYIDLSIYEEVG